jgi:hypothetical protein
MSMGDHRSIRDIVGFRSWFHVFHLVYQVQIRFGSPTTGQP